MSKFNAGQSFADGDTVTGAKLNNIAGLLDIYTGLISEQTAMVATVSTADQLLIADVDNGDSGAANRVTVQKLLNDGLTNGTFSNLSLTGNLNVTQLSTLGTLNNTRGTVGILNSTTGTIQSLTSSTANISQGSAIFTQGTINTLNSTTGTIGTLNNTTGTIGTLVATGTITGSTNVVNIGSGQIYKDASGNVGIGTTTATAAFQGTASKLGIEAPRTSSDQTLLSLAHTGTITASDKINIGFDSFSALSARRTMAQISAMAEDPNAGASGALLFYTNLGATSLTERMRINASGNVGIGTTSPTGNLDIYSATSASPIIRGDSTTRLFIYRASTDSGRASLFLMKARGNHASLLAVASGDNIGSVSFQAYGGTNLREVASVNAFVDTYTSDTNISSLLTFNTTPAGGVVLTERMRIDSDGDVGIGSTAPVNKLEVVGSFGRGAPVTKTTDFTLAATENWIIVNKATSCIATLPAASSWTGREFTIKTLQAVTVVSPTSNISPLNSATPGTAILSATAGAWATLVSDGTNWIKMAGS